MSGEMNMAIKIQSGIVKACRVLLAPGDWSLSDGIDIPHRGSLRPFRNDMYLRPQYCNAKAKDRKTALHLFRDLLRAASYLPDEFAQLYFRNYIKGRFRQAKKTPLRLVARLGRGRKSLSILQRAADGEIKPLGSVLFKAYGRSGRRRRELVVDLLQADAKSAPEYGVTAESIIAEGISQDGSWKTPRPVLDMFIRSQVANNPPENARPKIRNFEPQIPTNIFGKPMALKLQQNIARKFWASTLDKILPPLPELEWNRLRDLAMGRIPFRGPPQRRPCAGSAGASSNRLLDTTIYLKRAMRAADRHEKNAHIQDMNKHEITARFMRRMWAYVWNHSPMMSYDGETMKWTIVWGGSRSAASKGEKGSAGRKDLELFAGIDDLDQGPLLVRGPRGKHMNRPQLTRQSVETVS